MESVLEYPTAEEELLDDGLLEQQYEIKAAEESFRRLLGRVAVSLIFLASGLIVYYLMPFYPPTMAAFLALVPAGIAFRWPAIALFLLLLFAAPAYSYQLDVTIWALGILITIAIVLPFGLSRLPGASAGAAIGAASAVLMLTPYYYLALPLLIGSTALRLRGSTAGGGWAFFIFMAFYLPFLAVAQTSTAEGESLPLFTQIDYAQRSALTNLDLSSLKAAFDGQIGHSFSGFSGLSAYFVQGWGGVAIIFILLMTIVITPAIVNATRQLRFGGPTARALAPLVLMLTGALVFLLPLQLLAEPLGYYTGFATSGDIARVVGTMVGVGILAFLAEVWLNRRNLKVDLRTEMSILSLELYDMLDAVKQRLSDIRAIWVGNDLASEKVTINQYEEKIALALESSPAMGLARLELSYNEFRAIESDLPRLREQLEARLREHLEESRQAYRATVQQALALGIPTIEDVIETPPAPDAPDDPDEPLRKQERLNVAFQRLADELVATGDMVAATVKNEIDPEFQLTTIEISHGFLDQGRYEEAARTITEDLQIIDGRIEGSIVELATKVVASTEAFKDVLMRRVLPVLRSIGDSTSAAACESTISSLDTIADSVRDSRTLADIIGIVEQSRKLATLATSTVDKLGERINELEADNNRRCPPKYNWGRNSHTASEIQQLVASAQESSSEPTISGRFRVIENAVQALEHQARAIKQYGQANEFLINYPNIEYIVRDKLSTNKKVASSDLPVQPKYALEYLKMYATAHQGAVILDTKAGVLKRAAGNGSAQE